MMYRYTNVKCIDIAEFNKNKIIVNAIGNKKFDVVFSNPPYGDRYDNALDLKIVETINANKKVILQPANWVYADKSAGKAKSWAEKLGKYITDIYFCDFNALMGIKLRAYGDIIVYDYINKIDTINIVNCVLNESYKVNTIYDITKYGSMYNTLVKPFINKIKNKYKVFVDQKFSYDVNSDFAFRFSRYNGTAGQTDIYSPINKAGMKNHFIDKTFINNKQKNNFMWFIINDFKTNDEHIHFYNYGKTKCFRFLLSIYKNDVNFSSRSVSLVPWLDFSKEWNDYTLCKEFGISKDLWKYINKFIPDYYDDYDSKIPKRKPTIGPADQLALIYFRRLPKEFTFQEFYNLIADPMQHAYPNNHSMNACLLNILQTLRDNDYVEFFGNGHYKKMKDK